MRDERGERREEIVFFKRLIIFVGTFNFKV